VNDLKDGDVKKTNAKRGFHYGDDYRLDGCYFVIGEVQDSEVYLQMY